jgi:hypothetical protein
VRAYRRRGSSARSRGSDPCGRAVHLRIEGGTPPRAGLRVIWNVRPSDTYLSFGLYDAAIVELRAAVDLDPGCRAARERLIRCYERTHRFGEAIAGRAAADGPARVEPFALRRKLAASEARIVPGRPEVPAYLFNPPQLRLALGFAELGEWEQVIRWEEHAAAQFPAWRRWFTGRPELRHTPPSRSRE